MAGPSIVRHQLGWWSGVLLALSDTRAAVPALDHLFPVAFPAGTTNPVTAVGKFDPWPPTLWADHPGIVFHATTNQGAFVVEISPSVTRGAHLVRAFNPEGSSAPHFVIVTSETQTAEVEPNDHYAHPQVIATLPADIIGRLEKSGDVDSFAVTLAAGRTLVASVEACVLQSPVDAVLRIVDTRGVEVAFNHDGGRTIDPFLAWTAPAAGKYIVQVFGFQFPGSNEIQFTGNERCVYRLHLADGPWLSHTLPLGAQRGMTNRLQPVGWNLHGESASPFDCRPPVDAGPTIIVRVPGARNELTIPVGEGPELAEVEPNNVAAQAQPLPIPGAVTGRFENGGDVDRYAIEAAPGGPLEIAVQAADLGFPVEALLRIEDARGKVVTRVEESVLGDPSLIWTPGAVGRFVIVLESLVHRGGDRHLYRLSVKPGRPGFSATLPVSALVLQTGNTNELKVAITRRHGFTNTLMFSVEPLPAGVTASPLAVPPNSKEAVVRLSAATNAPPFNGPVRFLFPGSDGGPAAVFPLVGGGEINGVPQGFQHLLIDSIDHLWLTVKAGTNAAIVK